MKLVMKLLGIMLFLGLVFALEFEVWGESFERLFNHFLFFFPLKMAGRSPGQPPNHFEMSSGKGQEGEGAECYFHGGYVCNAS